MTTNVIFHLGGVVNPDSGTIERQVSLRNANAKLNHLTLTYYTLDILLF